MALAERVELECGLHCALYLQEAQGLVVTDETVWVVVNEQDAVVGSKLHRTLKKLDGSLGTGRHIGVVHNHQLNTGGVDSVEVGQPAVLVIEVILNNLATREGNCRAVGGVARVGNQHLVALINVCHADMHQTLLRTNQGENLVQTVELHIVVFLVPLSKCLAQDGSTSIRLVGVGGGLCSLLSQLCNHNGVGRAIGTTDTEVNHVVTLSTQLVNLTILLREVVLAYSI